MLHPLNIQSKSLRVNRYINIWTSWTAEELFALVERREVEDKSWVMKSHRMQTESFKDKNWFRKKDAKTQKREVEEEMEREISAVSETQKGISTVSCFSLHPPTPRLTPLCLAIYGRSLKDPTQLRGALKAEFMAS